VTRVAIVSDSSVVQKSLRELITANPALDLVEGRPDVPDGRRNGGDRFLAEVVLLDGDLEAIEHHVQRAKDGAGDRRGAPWLIVLADHPVPGTAAQALRAGARGVLPRDAGAAEVSVAIEAVAAGLIVVHPDAAATLVPASGSTVLEAPGQALTPREIDVLRMLAEGLGNKTIATRLGISEHTVKFHVGSIFVKLGAASRTEAVARGARQGLIML
jgi:two-component system, NarL family, response regulator YdfI